jgi:hypothetical protein
MSDKAHKAASLRSFQAGGFFVFTAGEGLRLGSGKVYCWQRTFHSVAGVLLADARE